jgi:hypothetical protein
MKKQLFIFILATTLSFSVFAQYDTLRMYDPLFVKTNYYSSTTYPRQMQRFYIYKPVNLKGFRILMDGDTGKVECHLFGHSGADWLMAIENDVIPPFYIYKQTPGLTYVNVELETPVYFSNNQFSLEFRNIPPVMRIIRDRKTHTLECNGSSGGQYFNIYAFQYLTFTDTTSSWVWYPVSSTSNYSLVVDAIVEYPLKESKHYLTDVTATAGFPTTLSNSSIAAGDFNDDGFNDLLISGSLFQNNNNGTFTDVTTLKGIKNVYSGIVGNAFVDIDNDGDLDIFLFGYDSSVVCVNDNGNFTIKALNLPKFKSFLSFSFADINNDKYPDLFVSQLWGTYPYGEPNYLFYNDGNFGFTDKTSKIYPDWDGTYNYPNNPDATGKNRNSRGSEWVDFDNDGDLDLYVTNYYLQQDEFYRNNGDGSFTDICADKGIDRNNTGANHGTGVDWYDYDNDGNMDLLLTQFAHPRFIPLYDHRGTAIYHNNGAPDFTFTDKVGQYNNYPGLVSPIGLELEETSAGGTWGDVNNDGLVDLFLTVFYDCRYVDFYEQQPDHTFRLKTFEYGLEKINTGTDAIWMDADNNGKLDLCGADLGQFRLFRNEYQGGYFVELNLRSTSANKYAIGAKAFVYSGGKMYKQEVSAGRGQKMQKPYTLHYGFGWATNIIDSVVVIWPGPQQKREKFTGIQTEHVYTLTEGGNVEMSVGKSADAENIFSIYPNPSENEIHIGLYTSKEEDVTIEIYNSLMQKTAVIYEGRLQKNNCDFSFSADDHNLTPAVYFCKLNIGSKTIVKQFIITR